MSDSKIVKSNIQTMLNDIVDKELFALGFKRRKGAIVYKRELPELTQEIGFSASTNPTYEPGAKAHIQPKLMLKIPAVSRKALDLVDDNSMLLAGAPDIILNQPIEHCAPSDKHERWFVRQESDYFSVGEMICSFIKLWLLDILNNLEDIEGFLRMHEQADERLLKQQHQSVFLCAAYLLKGQNEKALLVMENNLGRPGLRRRYSAVYDKLSN